MEAAYLFIKRHHEMTAAEKRDLFEAVAEVLQEALKKSDGASRSWRVDDSEGDRSRLIVYLEGWTAREQSFLRERIWALDHANAVALCKVVETRRSVLLVATEKLESRQRFFSFHAWWRCLKALLKRKP